MKLGGLYTCLLELVSATTGITLWLVLVANCCTNCNSECFGSYHYRYQKVRVDEASSEQSVYVSLHLPQAVMLESTGFQFFTEVHIQNYIPSEGIFPRGLRKKIEI